MEHATAKANQLIDGFQTSTAQLDRTLRKAQALIESFHGTSAQAGELMKDTREMVKDTHGVVKDAGDLVRNTNKVVENAGGLVADTRSTLTENREKLKDVLENLNASLKQLNGTLTDARSFLGDPELRGNLKDTAKNVRDATENLKGITSDVRNITGDPKVQDDLKVTVNRLRDVTEQASDVLQRVREVVGSSGKTAKTIGQRVSDAEISAQMTHASRADRTRVNFDATIPWSRDTFYRLGIFDFGEGNKFNIQAGQQVRSGIWARYGIHASKLGAGLDFGARAHPVFSMDLFGVDRPRLDAVTNLRLLPYLDLTLGLNSIFDRADPVVGVRYHNR
jgi:ABC-type transporter Mla subunit MlaD